MYIKEAPEVQVLKYKNKEDGGWVEVQLGENEKCNSFSADKIDGVYISTIDNSRTRSEELKAVEEQSEEKALSLLSLFRYATFNEKCFTVIGCVLAVLCGHAFPYIVILVGHLVDMFVNKELDRIVDALNSNETADDLFASSNQTSTLEGGFSGIPESIKKYIDHLRLIGNVTDDAFLEECKKLAMVTSLVSLGLLIGNYLMVLCLSVSAERQVYRIKCMFMRAILKQDMGWFDTHQTGDFSSRITIDLNRIRDGIGERICICVYFLSTSLLSVGCSLFYGWKLTLVVMSIMPIIVGSMAIISKIQANLSISELSAYGKAGAVAEGVFSSIRTVVAFGGEEKEMKRYTDNLQYAKKHGVKRGMVTGIGASLFWICTFCGYALAIWYGVQKILDSMTGRDLDYKPSTLMIVFFNVFQAAIYTGQATPYFESFAMARGAAMKIFSVISRVPSIDSSSNEGQKPSKLVGNIELRNVHFNYLARPEVKVLNGMSLTAKAGETIALVGPSGCGKSTVIQLIQRFYDPIQGKVLLDGNDIRELNVGWLRERIGVVCQEPVLFATSIKENIRHGFPEASEVEIRKAAIAANAHSFICRLPKQYDTIVGERGCQLSGGQKQRIAIARALVRNPRILLLDEATSALDTESEFIVQAALDQAREGRTTVVVAHRLSTIRNADKIIVIDKGVVREIGSHEQLMRKNGLYYQLVLTQDADNGGSPTQKPKFQPEMNRQISTVSTLSNGSVEKAPNGLHSVSKGGHDSEEEDQMPSQTRLLKLAYKEWPYLLIGVLSAIVTGLTIPVYGVVFGEFLYVLADIDDQKVKEGTMRYTYFFLVLAGIAGVSQFLQSFMFSIAGERVTKRLRRDVFSIMVRQHVGWFDDPQNGTGVLCSRLSSDAAQVQGATGSRLATTSQAMATLFAATFVGVYYNWKIGLVILCFIPVILVFTYLESRIISGHLLQEKKATEGATTIAVEAIENVRTVVSLHQESSFYRSYEGALQESQKNLMKRCNARGLTFGFAQAVPCIAYAIAMYYGSYLIVYDGLNFGDLFKVTESIIFGTMMMGEAVSFAPNYQKAKAATIRIFKLLDLKSNIDPLTTAGLKMPPIKGQILLKNVRFNYPTRPGVTVLNDINMVVEPGQTVALVGSSGCGKSTCVQLLERFYDAQDGELCVDGMNVKNLNVSWLRTQIGLVSQEPVLFGYSIAENIAYGDNRREVPMAEIIEAARKANIHQFISNLPAGYDTCVGDRGAQLSGGQKQRIAIARALVRNPGILLLDEATSALDTESEKVVQEALDNARQDRTSIVIAHRLSTIRNADKIVVIHKGRVAEEGTHNELLAKQGLYYRLCSVQSGLYAK